MAFMTGLSSGKIKRSRSRMFLILFSIFCIVLAAYPLFSGMVASANGSELDYNLLRIESIKNGLADGVFPVRINAEFFDGYGYGASLMEPDLFLYIPAVLRLLGFDLNFSYNIFLLACVCVTFAVVYGCGKHLARSRYVGLLAAVLTVLSQYYANVLYYRAALGEVLAFLFIPLVVWGVHDLLQEDFRHPHLLFIGYVGLYFSHIVLFLITVVISVVYCLIFLRRFIKKPRCVGRLLLVYALTALITMCSWLPILEQFGSTEFWIPWLNMDRITASVGSLLSLSQNYAEGEYGIPALGAVLLILCVARLFVRPNRGNAPLLGKADKLLVLGVLCIWVASRYFPINIWWMIDGLGRPTTVFVGVTILLAFAAAILLHIKISGRRARSAALFGVMSLCACILLIQSAITPLQYAKRTDDYFLDSYYTYPVKQTSIFPMGTEYSDFDHAGQILFEDGSLQPYTEKENTQIIFDCKAIQPGQTQASEQTEQPEVSYHTYADVPLLYYDGYAAEFTDQNGEVTSLEVTADGYGHTARVLLPQQEGQVRIWYQGTTIQLVSLIVSGVSTAAAIAALIIVGRRGRKGQKDQPEPAAQEVLAE